MGRFRTWWEVLALWSMISLHDIGAGTEPELRALGSDGAYRLEVRSRDVSWTLEILRDLRKERSKW